jgi:23S rRNA U2552 (ribose-2'-O)-methylase RlmE/FtsJ
MISFTLPRLNRELYLSIDTTKKQESWRNHTDLYESEQYYLENIEKSIQKVKIEWDIYKTIANAYEYLHSPIPFENFNVCMLNRPRTFFIITEILHKFFLEHIRNSNSITTFDFSDHSNGMSEAMINLRHQNVNDKHMIMNKSKSIMGVNIIICDPKTNILDQDHFKYITKKYKSSIDYITINIEKEDSYQIFSAQICYALCIQKNNGTLILKFLDTFSTKSIDVIGLLASMYDEVFMTKPLSSKNYHSESYLVCKNFSPDAFEKYYPCLLDYFTNVLSDSKLTNLTFFNGSSCINEYFSNKVKEYSTIFTQYQIEQIHSTLNIIATDKNKKIHIHSSFKPDSNDGLTNEFNQQNFEKSKVQYLLNMNIKKCLQFCSSHDIEINKALLQLITP